MPCMHKLVQTLLRGRVACSRFEPCPGPVSQWCEVENQLAPVPSCFFMAPPFHSGGLDISSSSPVIALGHHGAGPSDLLCVFPGCHCRPCRAANSAVLPLLPLCRSCHSATLPAQLPSAGSSPLLFVGQRFSPPAPSLRPAGVVYRSGELWRLSG